MIVFVIAFLAFAIATRLFMAFGQAFSDGGDNRFGWSDWAAVLVVALIAALAVCGLFSLIHTMAPRL